MATKDERLEIIKRKKEELDTAIVVHPSKIEFDDGEAREKLRKKVKVEDIETRKGPGGVDLSYVPINVVINNLNEVFGFNNWQSQILKEEIIHKEQVKYMWQVVTRTLVRITIAGCAKEDVGWGNSMLPNLADALETSSKTATSDGIKRCARQFGNYTGNCLYDRKFLRSLK